jgi:hypothetical protein
MRRVHDETIRGAGLIFRKVKRYDCFSNELFETFSGMRGVSSTRVAIRIADNSTIIDGSIENSTTARTEIRFMQNHFEWAFRIIRKLFNYPDDNNKRGGRP